MNSPIPASSSTAGLVSFIFYCVTFLGIGAIITGLGPLIPYFAEREHRSATEYSFLFFCRAAGYCLGSLLCKIWEKFFRFHNICFVCSILIGFCLIAFSWIELMALKALFMFLAAIMNATLEIFINMSIIEAKKNDHLDKWLQINHGAFGVGGLIGPLLVFWFEEWSYGAMCVIFWASAPAYLLLDSPENTSHLAQEPLISEERGNTTKKMPLAMNLLVCVLFLMLVGEETAYGGWISSYAVINHIQSKERSTFYGSLFWVVVTAFRFIFLVLPGKPSQKSLAMYIGSLFIAATTLLFLHFLPAQSHIWVIYSSVGFGIFFSILFPMLLSTPKEFGIDLSPSDNSNFVIAASLGEGIVAVFTGYLMDWFGSDMLFYSIIAVNILVLTGHFILICQLKNETHLREGRVIQCEQTATKQDGGFSMIEVKHMSATGVQDERQTTRSLNCVDPEQTGLIE